MAGNRDDQPKPTPHQWLSDRNVADMPPEMETPVPAWVLRELRDRSDCRAAIERLDEEMESVRTQLAGMDIRLGNVEQTGRSTNDKVDAVAVAVGALPEQFAQAAFAHQERTQNSMNEARRERWSTIKGISEKLLSSNIFLTFLGAALLLGVGGLLVPKGFTASVGEWFHASTNDKGEP